MSFAFPRELRLLTPNDFRFVFQSPHFQSAGKIRILSRPNSLDFPRLGLIVSKKSDKKAHERNRVKRLIRETFRHYRNVLPKNDFVVIVKPGLTLESSKVIHSLLGELWKRHIRL